MNIKLLLLFVFTLYFTNFSMANECTFRLTNTNKSVSGDAHDYAYDIFIPGQFLHDVTLALGKLGYVNRVSPPYSADLEIDLGADLCVGLVVDIEDKIRNMSSRHLLYRNKSTKCHKYYKKLIRRFEELGKDIGELIPGYCQEKDKR